MCPDYRKYLTYLEGTDLTEAQKAELIHSVWTVMESFADRAFGLHPVQQAKTQDTKCNSKMKKNCVRSGNNSNVVEFNTVAGLILQNES